MSTKQIVCLANSRKIGDRCIAGKVLGTNEWVRPVSNRADRAVTRLESAFVGGGEPALLDVIEIRMLHREAEKHQPENWLFDPAWKWQRAGRVPMPDLGKYLDAPAQLWINGLSAQDGENDRIPESTHVAGSLFLIKVPDLTLDSHQTYRGTRVRGEFQVGHVGYRLMVTDPVVEAAYRAHGRYQIGPSYLTVSLGEAYGGYCYKLIAGVIAATN